MASRALAALQSGILAIPQWFAQVAAVSWFGLQTVPQRLGSAAATIFGIAGVVGVLVGVLSIAQGFQYALQSAGAEDMAIVLRSGSTSEMMSGLSRDTTLVIADTEGVARNARGPLASAELFVIIDLPKRTTGTTANVPLRGVGEAAFEVRDGITIVEGRPFDWGRNEVIIGAGAAREFAGLDVGSSLEVGGDRWRIVGMFTADGGIAESEIWTDARLLQSAYRRGDSFQAVYARLESPATFELFKGDLDNDPRVDISVIRSTDYYAEQSVLVTNLITGVGFLIAALMAVGAVFGALNTMYSAVSARTREIATLRALGFKNGPIVISVLFESLILALAGGVVGGLAALLIFNGLTASTINWQSFSQVTFAFAVTPPLLLQGAVFAALIGLLGGLLPAIRAARLPVATGLREG
ncbi:MAG TPA: ABC transporter permease [Acidobacteriota bacterium]